MERVNYYPGTDALYLGVVDSGGADGRNGSNGADGMPGGSGSPGSPGTNATPSTHGENAHQMRVVLKRREYASGTHIEAHCVTPSNTPARQEWLLNGQDMILLRAKGGDGGHGGKGGHGGDGGTGMGGVAADGQQPGTWGGDGGSGGNGGNGTSGSNGGSGGYIEIEVEENDTDLLVPVHWDVRGGIGGSAGENGFGGTGGSGGWGGRGYGDRGMNGYPGNAILSDGQHGQPGSARIQVHMNSTRELGARHNFYTSRYFFYLVDFQVIDENQDGIFEPGEHILIQNIRIKNTGGMPTPSQHPIPIHIVASDWFEPYENEPVYIPPGIPPGEIVTINGPLRARIKYPPEPWGQPFNVKTQIEFLSMIPRLNGRIIRDWHGKYDVSLNYPISIETARWADSVLPNTKMIYIWTITNKSTKGLGISSEQARAVEFILQGAGETARSDQITFSNSQALSSLVSVNNIEPGQTLTFTQEVFIKSTAEIYTHFDFTLTLSLGRPGNVARDIVQVNDLRVQIAAPYAARADNPAGVLLVINCNTTRAQIQNWHNIMLLIGVVYDVWNVSLYGGYDLPADRSTVLQNYTGKGIALFGDDFNFFQQGGVRNAMDLITPELAFSLATHGSTFLIIGGKSPSVNAWWKQVVYPQFGSDPVAYENKKALVYGLRASGIHNTGTSIPMSASRNSKTKGTFENRAQKTAKKIRTKFPLERFQIYPAAGNPNQIVVKQSLPVACRIMNCSTVRGDLANLDNLHIFAILTAMPIAARLRFALNLAGPVSTPYDEKPEPSVGVSDLLIPELIKLSIINDLEQELARYLHKAPWPHRLNTQVCHIHLKKLHEFMGSWPAGAMDSNQIEMVVDIFTHLLRAVRLKGLGEVIFRFGHRKTNLRNYIILKLKEFLSTRGCPQDQFSRMKKLANDDKSFRETISRVSAHTQIGTGDIQARLNDSNEDQNLVLDTPEAAVYRNEYVQRINRYNADCAASQYVLGNLVQPPPMIV